MKFQRYFLATVTVFVVTFAGLVFLGQKVSHKSPKPVLNVPKDAQLSHKEFIIDMMRVVGVKTSKADQALTVEMVDRVTKKVYGDDIKAAHGFITLLAIESRFDNKAKSHAGAVGYAQIIPRYVMEFASHCDLDIVPSDVYNPEINLMLGACLYRHLLAEYKNTSMSLVAYNAGKFSTQLKQLKAQTQITNSETANYIIKFHYLQELAKQ